METDSFTHLRKEPRFNVRVPIKVSGIDKDGYFFCTQTNTLNGSLDGIGLILEQELYPFTALVISIPFDQRVLQLHTEVRHITSVEDNKKIAGVRIHKIAVV